MNDKINKKSIIKSNKKIKIVKDFEINNNKIKINYKNESNLSNISSVKTDDSSPLRKAYKNKNEIEREKVYSINKNKIYVLFSESPPKNEYTIKQEKDKTENSEFKLELKSKKFN